MSLILESTVTTLPLVLLVLLFGAVVTKSKDIFLLAFVSGILLDILTFKTIGLSSLFYVLFIMLVFLYDRKFEISTVNFVLVSSFIVSFLYIIIFNLGNAFLQSIFSSVMISASYLAYKAKNKKVVKYASYG